MRLPSVAAVIALVLLVACEPSTPSPRRPTNSASPTSPNAGAVELSFPGGGSILFRPSRGPGYISHGIGVVRSDGLVRRFAAGLWTFPYWDPATPGHILTLSFESKPQARSFRIEDGQLRSVGAWRTSEGTFTFPSPDGRTIAYTPFGPERLRIGILRLVDRATGSSRTIRSDDLVPEGWTPNGKLLAAPWFGGDSVLWDPETGNTTPFGQRRLGSIVWAPDGDQFRRGDQPRRRTPVRRSPHRRSGRTDRPAPVRRSALHPDANVVAGWRSRRLHRPRRSGPGGRQKGGPSRV